MYHLLFFSFLLIRLNSIEFRTELYIQTAGVDCKLKPFINSECFTNIFSVHKENCCKTHKQYNLKTRVMILLDSSDGVFRMVLIQGSKLFQECLNYQLYTTMISERWFKVASRELKPHEIPLQNQNEFYQITKITPVKYIQQQVRVYEF